MTQRSVSRGSERPEVEVGPEVELGPELDLGADHEAALEGAGAPSPARPADGAPGAAPLPAEPPARAASPAEAQALDDDHGPALTPAPVLTPAPPGSSEPPAALPLAPTLPPPAPSVPPPSPSPSSPVIEVPEPRASVHDVAGSGQTDVGRSRRHNEDHILFRNDLGLYVVSDGMGGHNAGEVASALAVVSIQNFFEAKPLESFFEPGEDDLLAGARRLAGAIHKANADIFEISTTHPKHRGMGCTVVAAYVQAPGDVVHISHVGDSRCYRLRDGRLEQLTRDHSLINDLLQLKPDLSEADVAHLPKNVVTRALGIEAQVHFDVRTEELEKDDVFLLCSDGLSGMVTDEQMASVLEITTEPVEASEILVAMANDAGGHDNISVVIFRVDT